MAEDEMPFLNILEYKETGNKPKRLQTILDAISDDEWMPHLEHYRNIEQFRPQTYEFDDFEKKFAKRSNKKPACI